MNTDLPSVGTEDARRVSEADLADLMALHKLTSEGVWAQGQTSHHTIAKREGRDDYRIAEFHHASDASFVDVAHKYMPLLIGEVTDLRRERDELASRVRELEGDARRYEWLRENNAYSIHDRLFADCPMHKFNDAMLDAAIDAAISAKKGQP